MKLLFFDTETTSYFITPNDKVIVFDKSKCIYGINELKKLKQNN